MPRGCSVDGCDCKHYGRRTGKWRAYLGGDHFKHLGTFGSPKDAAVAYNEAAVKQYGDFACLNVGV
jgi:hypothetical protein